MTQSKIHIRRFDILTICIFCILISIPLISSFVSEKKGEPIIFTSLKKFPSEYQINFEENFEFRKQLITAYYFIKIKFLRETFVNNRIIQGKDGWLYYSSPQDGITIDDFEGKIILSREELNKIKNNLEQQDCWLRNKNIKYLIVVCPSKHTIYPENLPGSLERGRSILDQMESYLKVNSKIQILDLRNILLESKQKYPYTLYFKTDTHWNSLGAFLGYQEIMKALSKDPLQLSDFKIEEKESKGRDITEMIGMQDFFTDKEIIIDNQSKFVSNKMKSLVIFNDSYFYYMEPFLKNHFDTIVSRPHFWNSFDYNVINEIKPEVVIYQVTERYVKQLLRDNPEEIIKAVPKLP